MPTVPIDPETASRRAAATAAFLDRMADLCEQERAKLTPAQQRRDAASSPESVANMRAHAAAIRRTLP
ncbi:MAG: hypothetical protein ABSA21_11765 [Candidatus Limnocylindrales bacterium]|jgi:hypothetical protein